VGKYSLRPEPKIGTVGKDIDFTEYMVGTHRLYSEQIFLIAPAFPEGGLNLFAAR
jgi:hypothetical protein